MVAEAVTQFCLEREWVSGRKTQNPIYPKWLKAEMGKGTGGRRSDRWLNQRTVCRGPRTEDANMNGQEQAQFTENRPPHRRRVNPPQNGRQAAPEADKPRVAIGNKIVLRFRPRDIEATGQRKY